MNVLKKSLSAVLLTIAAASTSAAPIFVGSWDLYGGEDWFGHTAPILTGQAAAAALFGGMASDYVLSTNGDNIGSIDFSAWYDVYGFGPSVHAQDYFVDTGSIGVYDRPGDTSAYIRDNAGGRNLINYAFRVEPPADVPEPLTLGLLGIGMLGMGLAHRRKAM